MIMFLFVILRFASSSAALDDTAKCLGCLGQPSPLPEPIYDLPLEVSLLRYPLHGFGRLATNVVGTPYHTSLVIGDLEVWFDGIFPGIFCMPYTPEARPLDIRAKFGFRESYIALGRVDAHAVPNLIEKLTPIFQPQTYDQLLKNCNHFTDAATMLLLGHRATDLIPPNVFPEYRMAEKQVRRFPRTRTAAAIIYPMIQANPAAEYDHAFVILQAREAYIARVLALNQAQGLGVRILKKIFTSP